MGDKYRPQKGDRVRVVLESTVGYVDSTSSFSTYYNGFHFEQEDLVSVEKIEDPLPTTPGSVVRLPRYSGGWNYIVRQEQPHWLPGAWSDYAMSREPWSVVFDAGKAL